jgi:hypothetical protein
MVLQTLRQNGGSVFLYPIAFIPLRKTFPNVSDYNYGSYHYQFAVHPSGPRGCCIFFDWMDQESGLHQRVQSVIQNLSMAALCSADTWGDAILLSWIQFRQYQFIARRCSAKQRSPLLGDRALFGDDLHTGIDTAGKIVYSE